MIACPHCGAEISEDAKFCRYCGSSDSDGWRDESSEAEEWADEDDFDYEQYVRDHHSDTQTATGTPTIWRFVAVVLLVLFAAATFGFLF